MTKKIITLAAILINSLAFSQQIGDGLAAPYLSNFSDVLKSGVYGGYGATLGKVPDNSADWNHLFVIRHANPDNNFQLQIASSFAENERLFFRKIAGDLNPRNPAWTELATRGTNNFIGNQIITGNVGIGTSTPTAFLEVYSPNLTVGSNDTQKWSSRNPEYYLKLQTIWDENGINQEFIQRYNGTDYKSLVFFGGNVGIGKTNPNNKLDVNGAIHSKEVKVDMIGWPDFVFKKEYNLPTLVEVERHINEKGHLENIPNEEEVLKNGISLGEMDAKLLRKIEELTLYSIQQAKEIEKLKKENKSYQELSERLFKIEQKLK